MRYAHNEGEPTYAPNSVGSPVVDERAGADLGWAGPARGHGPGGVTLHAKDDDYGQPRKLVRDVLDDTGCDHLTSNITGHLQAGSRLRFWSGRASYWRSGFRTGVPGTSPWVTASPPASGLADPA
jgi:catalase